MIFLFTMMLWCGACGIIDRYVIHIPEPFQCIALALGIVPCAYCEYLACAWGDRIRAKKKQKE